MTLTPPMMMSFIAVTNLLFVARKEDQDKHHVLVEGVRLASQAQVPDMLEIFHQCGLTRDAGDAQHSQGTAGLINEASSDRDNLKLN